MAVAKRRLGRTRIHHRRSSWMRNAVTQMATQKCPSCEQVKVAHRVCASCGHYNGKKVVEVAADEIS